MQEDRTSVLPVSLHRYFWDHEPVLLTLDGSRQTILKRLLESGGWDAVVWLRREFGVDEIRDILVRRRGRGISPRRLRFWAVIVSLPREQVDEWIATQRSNPWGARLHR
jgi:hypothetical protein